MDNKDQLALIKENVKAACRALADKKAYDIKILNVGEVSAIADYFIIANGTNPSQIGAMVDGVDEAMVKNGLQAKSIEGQHNSSWILMDYGDIIVHIFSKEDREFYNLERIWADCSETIVNELI